MSDLRTKSLKAFKWNVLSQVFNQVLILVVNVTLVRLLSPEEFGLLAVPFVVYSFFRMLQDFGYSDVMIKEKEIDQNLFSTIYWMIVIGGFLVSIVNYYLSPMIGYWTNSANTIIINQCFSVILFIGSFSIGLEGMMRKELNFKLPFFIEFIANLIAGIVAIYLACIGWSWKALVIRFLIHIVLQFIFNFIYTKWRPALVFNAKLLKPHFTFASLSITEQVLNFLNRNVDTLLISRYIGNHALGLYDRSFKLLLFPLQQVSGAFSKVMFPAFSKIQDDKEKVGQHFLKIVALISFITFPMMIGIFALCEDFVFVVFGAQWMAMVPVLKLFSLISIFQSISTVTGSVFSATDNMKTLIKYSMYSKPLSIAAIFLAIWIHKDIYYVALYITIASFIMMFPLWHILAKSICIKSIDIWRAIFPQLILSIVMAIICGIVVEMCHIYEISPYVTLAIGTIIGIIAYGSLVAISGNQAAKWAIELTKSFWVKDQNSQMISQ